jgi:hypothetical protein
LRSSLRIADSSASRVIADSIFAVGIPGNNFASTEAYDSAQSQLPDSLKDNWIKRRIMYRTITMNQEYQSDKQQLGRNISNRFVHTFPYLLFVSLPLYAVYLKWLYPKKYLYSGHAIFLIYLYVFTFVDLLAIIAVDQVESHFHIQWLRYIRYALLLYGIGYTLVAMKNFYHVRWGKTIGKFILLNILAFISLIILFTLFFVFTLFRI